MAISFEWRRGIHPVFGRIAVPVARVEFEDSQGGWKPVEPIVDSGAVISLITPSFFRLLGLPLPAGPPIVLRGIGRGAVRAHVAAVRLRIGETEFPARVAVSTVGDVPNLLGRLDVFDRFDVLLRAAEHRTVFVSRRG